MPALKQSAPEVVLEFIETIAVRTFEAIRQSTILLLNTSVIEDATALGHCRGLLLKMRRAATNPDEAVTSAAATPADGTLHDGCCNTRRVGFTARLQCASVWDLGVKDPPYQAIRC